MVGSVALVATLAAISFGAYIVPDNWVPYVWLAATIAMAGSTILGIVSARSVSKWWYLLSAASLISLCALLAAVAVQGEILESMLIAVVKSGSHQLSQGVL